MAKELSQGVYWIGTDNPSGKDFHGIDTYRGGSYNSFLIKDRSPALVDGVNIRFYEGFMRSIREVIDPKEIRYLIINHAEPDHAGAVRRLSADLPNAALLCTKKCKSFLTGWYGVDDARITEVTDGFLVSIGQKTIRFIMSPFAHWPETMMTYIVEDKVLFSGDLFATEISRESEFADEMKDFSKLTEHYFAIVMRPYHAAVKKAIASAKSLELSMLCPSHGPAYRNDIQKIIEIYEKLASEPEEKRVSIIYYSVWHNTEDLAMGIAKGLRESGVKVEIFDIAKDNMIAIMSSVMTSRITVIGSMTIVGGFHPMFAALFQLFSLLQQKGKAVFVFGSHGWAPGSVPKLKEACKNIGWDVKGELDVLFSKKEDDDVKLKEFVGQISMLNLQGI